MSDEAPPAARAEGAPYRSPSLAYRERKPTGPYIGGQAVLEGVMMRSPTSFAVVVRRRDGSLHVRERGMSDHAQGLREAPARARRLVARREPEARQRVAPLLGGADGTRHRGRGARRREGDDERAPVATSATSAASATKKSGAGAGLGSSAMRMLQALGLHDVPAAHGRRRHRRRHAAEARSPTRPRKRRRPRADRWSSCSS